ncbi:MAG: alkaline phosphatase [Clostridiales bacterium]|nr:alkaline phosphatase [Clostridiales bacterium]
MKKIVLLVVVIIAIITFSLISYEVKNNNEDILPTNSEIIENTSSPTVQIIESTPTTAPTPTEIPIEYDIKYIFLFIGDGMGFDIVDAANDILMHNEDRQLCFLDFESKGEVITTLESGAATDSGAAATSLATGVNTYDGAIGVDSNGKSVENLIEYIAARNLKTGVISTVTIDHATPAGFYAHQKNRSMYDEIIKDAIASPLNVLAGGYTSAGVSKTTMRKWAKGTGFEISSVGSGDEFSADKGIYLADIPFVNDNDGSQSTLTSLLTHTVENLYSDSGFFIMAEAGKIDWAMHNWSWADGVSELLDMEEAISYAVDFYDEHPDETMIIITADHETGGFIYDGQSNHEQFNAIDTSYSRLNSYIKSAKKKGLSTGYVNLKEYLIGRFGFDYADGTQNATWVSSTNSNRIYDAFKDYCYNRTSSSDVMDIIFDVINSIAGERFTTTVHSKKNVPVYALGRYAKIFEGVYDNTMIYHKIKNIIDIYYP